MELKKEEAQLLFKQSIRAALISKKKESFSQQTEPLMLKGVNSS